MVLRMFNSAGGRDVPFSTVYSFPIPIRGLYCFLGRICGISVGSNCKRDVTCYLYDLPAGSIESDLNELLPCSAS